MSHDSRAEREWLEGLRYEDKFPAPRPTWQCEYCGRFYSERTAAAHGWCQQEQDRKDAERAWPA